MSSDSFTHINSPEADASGLLFSNMRLMQFKLKVKQVYCLIGSILGVQNPRSIKLRGF